MHSDAFSHGSQTLITLTEQSSNRLRVGIYYLKHHNALMQNNVKVTPAYSHFQMIFRVTGTIVVNTRVLYIPWSNPMFTKLSIAGNMPNRRCFFANNK